MSLKKGFWGSSVFPSDLVKKKCAKLPEPLPHLSLISKLYLCSWSELWNFLPSISLGCFVSQQVHMLIATTVADPIIFQLIALIYYCFEFEFGIHCICYCILMRLSASKVCSSPPFFPTSYVICIKLIYISQFFIQ